VIQPQVQDPPAQEATTHTKCCALQFSLQYDTQHGRPCAKGEVRRVLTCKDSPV
jgi:hypothetical protein